ncbi:MAG: hypothetical protein KQA41_00875 [Candidatus Aenigmarchaeota archaeon]|nr:hypothetical protein [Candidatus Aenigmarchaeota archaeon]MBU5688769.1 hypothetical protein [Candidatus Aenigmarchaeota archaeon]
MDISKINRYILLVFIFILIISIFFLSRIFVRRQVKTFSDAKNYELELSECQNICNKIKNNCNIEDAVNYCTKKVFLDIDYNGIVGEAGKIGILNNYPFCEDGIYCFHLNDCKCNKTNLDPANCLKILCQYYNDSENPMEKIRQTITWGKCKNKDKIQPDWWYEYFGFYSETCENIQKTKGIITNCFYYDKKLTCETTCRKIDNISFLSRDINPNINIEETYYGNTIKIDLDFCLKKEKIKIVCKDPEIEKIQYIC